MASAVLWIGMVNNDDNEVATDSSSSSSGSAIGLSAAGEAAQREMRDEEAGGTVVVCSEREPPGQFQFRILDEDGEPVELRQPLEYRVYEEDGAVVQEGMLDSGDIISVDADPSGRYSLWLDGEYVTFHDENGES